MNRPRHILLMTAAVLLAAGCDKQSGGADVEVPSGSAIRVSAQVGGQTRATYGPGAPESLKEFDLVVDTFVGGEDPYINPSNGYCYMNSRFTYDSGSGEWIPSAAASKMLWYNSSTKVRVAAMAPCLQEGSYTLGWNYGNKFLLNGAFGGLSTAVTFEVQSEQSKDDYSSDLLFYYEKDKTPKDLLVDGKLPITFQHMLSNLVITFKLGTEFNQSGVPAEDIISDVVVSGTKRNVRFKQGDEFTLSVETYGEASDVKPYNSSWTSAADKTGNCISVYECILAPQTVAADQFKLSFNAAGRAYNWTLPSEYVFEGNYIHYLSLRVGKDAVVLDGVSTEKWGEEDRGTIETD